MTLRQLEYFRAICKYNNISRAAAELHVSQPGLSGAMRELEAEFGVPLFRRVSRGMELTGAGAALLEEAVKVLDQADRLRERMGQLGGERGTIRLGVPPMLAALIFPRLLAAFHTVCPDIRLEMAENGTLTNKELVREGKLDAAIASSDTPLPPTFATTDLCLLPICLYVSAKKTLRADSFAETVRRCPVPFVCLADDSFLTDYLNRQFREHGLSPNIMLHTNQLITIQQLIEDGMAAAFLYDHVLEERSSIAKIPVPDLPKIQVRLVWDSARKPSRAFEHLIRLAKDEKFLSRFVQQH